MITDQETNIVYFSELLRTTKEFESACERIINILEKHHIKYDFLKGTKDIWARDYMPIQTNTNRFIQFRYEPSYLIDRLDIQSDPHEVCDKNNINPIYSCINLDGGNIVKGNNRVLITDRIFSENPKYTNPENLVKEIENLLETECILIPQIRKTYDFTGHADGLVKFINDSKILVSDLNQEFKYWSESMKKVIEKYKFEHINMPLFSYYEKNFPESAIGCYMNYLEIENLIIFPIFDVLNNMDDKAVELIKSIYPNKDIETININEIVRQGGLMNCISWNIKI